MRARLRSGMWLPAVVVALAGLLVGLSFVPGWVVHVRHVGGHGLTEIVAVWNAWQGRAWPFLPLAVLAGAAAGTLAVVELARPGRFPRGWPIAASVACLALLLASVWPLDRTGYASRVQVSAGWPLYAGIALGGGMVLAALSATGWARRGLLAAAAGIVVVGAAGLGGRVVALNLAEGDPRSYTGGMYVRPAAAGQPEATLVIGDGTFRVDGRWSGTLSGRGLVVVLTGDPRCPEARGSYRIFPVGEEDIRWNTIVDLCADGERARDLTTGVWERQP